MAITLIDYAVLSKLKEAGILPPNPSILELGEANWYGDVSLDQLAADIPKWVTDPAAQAALLQELAILKHRLPSLPAHEQGLASFDIAKIFLRAVFEHRSMEAIDLDGRDSHRFDLNYPVSLDKTYDVVMNLGTAEHVFNVFQFFKTMHDLTAPGGLMFNEMPFSGWVDHGFYSFHPTFYFDLAAINNYDAPVIAYVELAPCRVITLQRREDILRMAQQGQIAKNSMIYAVFRKPQMQQEFKTPIQGYYGKTLSEEANQAWAALR